MHACSCCICFRFSVFSQGIGWEERLRNDLFCVLTQSIKENDHLTLIFVVVVYVSVIVEGQGHRGQGHKSIFTITGEKC